MQLYWRPRRNAGFAFFAWAPDRDLALIDGAPATSAAALGLIGSSGSTLTAAPTAFAVVNLRTGTQRQVLRFATQADMMVGALACGQLADRQWFSSAAP